MSASTSSTRSGAGIGKGFDAEEIRRTIELGKKRGLIMDATQACRVDKTGLPAAALNGITSQWMDIDPAKAEKWLKNNFRNRPVSDDTVTTYARDMANGVWIPTHQGIAFNDRDELIDGQHRLLAIQKSGRTIRTMVTFGLPSKIDGKEMTTMDAVDRGRTRSVADQLKIQHGMKNGSAIASVCALLGGICYGERTRRLSVGQVLEIYRAFEGPMNWVIERRSNKPGLRATGVLAAFTFALATVEHCPANKVIAPLFEKLMNGETFKRTSAAHHLSTFLQSDAAKLLSRSTDRGLAEMVLEAIRLDVQGHPVTKLEMSVAGAGHFRGLQAQRAEKIRKMMKLEDQR